jgi:glycine hydroxymethyltransferase
MTLADLPRAGAPEIGSSPTDLLRTLDELVDAHEQWRSRCLNLDAAESLTSDRAARVLSGDMAMRAAAGKIGHRTHRGAVFIDRMEQLAQDTVARLFGARYAELQIPTGSVANALAIRALTEPGDVVLRPAPPRGHPTFGPTGFAGHRGLRTVDVPLVPETFDLDMDALATLARTHRPAVIQVGTALMLFPYDLAGIRAIADEVRAKVVYDAAHVLGLVAGGVFQNPLADGADLVTGTTYKSFSGPLGGLLLHDSDDLDTKLRPLIGGAGYIGTYNHARVLATAITALEWQQFGADLAAAMLRNAQVLADALRSAGFDLAAAGRGFTQTHVVLLKVAGNGGGLHVSELLERAGIITMSMQLADEPSRDGLRIATTEITRRGMADDEMRAIAGFMARTVLHEEAPDRVAADVADFMSAWNGVRFSFDE